MKIAIPVENGRLNSHFGGSRQFALIEVDTGRKAVLYCETLQPPEHEPGVFPRWLHEQGAQVVIAGGIGQRALAIFAHHGIQVLAGQPDTPVGDLVTAYLAGTLTRTPDGCAHHHEHGHEAAV